MRLRRFAFALALFQLLIALIGFSGARPARENHPAIDVALVGASIARLPDRTVEASKPDTQDAATLPTDSILPSSSWEYGSARATSTRIVSSRIAQAPRARAPPHRA